MTAATKMLIYCTQQGKGWKDILFQDGSNLSNEKKIFLVQFLIMETGPDSKDYEIDYLLK